MGPGDLSPADVAGPKAPRLAKTLGPRACIGQFPGWSLSLRKNGAGGLVSTEHVFCDLVCHAGFLSSGYTGAPGLGESVKWGTDILRGTLTPSLLFKIKYSSLGNALLLVQSPSPAPDTPHAPGPRSSRSSALRIRGSALRWGVSCRRLHAFHYPPRGGAASVARMEP